VAKSLVFFVNVRDDMLVPLARWSLAFRLTMAIEVA
jgi:hypothetical protein